MTGRSPQQRPHFVDLCGISHDPLGQRWELVAPDGERVRLLDDDEAWDCCTVQIDGVSSCFGRCPDGAAHDWSEWASAPVRPPKPVGALAELAGRTGATLGAAVRAPPGTFTLPVCSLLVAIASFAAAVVACLMALGAL